jgi:hypothetical protein
MRAEHQENHAQSQRARQEADSARQGLSNIAQQSDQLQDVAARVNLFSHYLDPARRYTLVGTTRQETPEWKTAPLLKAPPRTQDARQPAYPAPEDMIDDDKRTEAMQKFVDADDQVAAVRDKLSALYTERGRDAVRRQVERYCQEALEPAIRELGEDDPVRHQLEVELAELQEVISELRPATGSLKLSR